MRFLLRFGLAPLSVLSALFDARGDVTPAPLFSEHMVLQRDKPVPIWGTGEAGEKVTVVFADQRHEATAGYDGHWLVVLPPLTTSSVGADLTIAGKNTIVLHDVVVGEVWLCSGQ